MKSLKSKYINQNSGTLITEKQKPSISKRTFHSKAYFSNISIKTGQFYATKSNKDEKSINNIKKNSNLEVVSTIACDNRTHSESDILEVIQELETDRVKPYSSFTYNNSPALGATVSAAHKLRSGVTLHYTRKRKDFLNINNSRTWVQHRNISTLPATSPQRLAQSSENIIDIIREITTNPMYVKISQILNSTYPTIKYEGAISSSSVPHIDNQSLNNRDKQLQIEETLKYF
jgi:hypothetical protein